MRKLLILSAALVFNDHAIASEYCMKSAIDKYDDGISPADVIAKVVINECDPGFSVSDIPGNNDMVGYMRRKEFDTALKLVLEKRVSARR